MIQTSKQRRGAMQREVRKSVRALPDGITLQRACQDVFGLAAIDRDDMGHVRRALRSEGFIPYNKRGGHGAAQPHLFYREETAPDAVLSQAGAWRQATGKALAKSGRRLETALERRTEAVEFYEARGA